jgi:hypothetical protein
MPKVLQVYAEFLQFLRFLSCIVIYWIYRIQLIIRYRLLSSFSAFHLEPAVFLFGNARVSARLPGGKTGTAGVFRTGLVVCQV